MKKIKYSCDGGSLLLYKDGNGFCINNGFGDGEFNCFIKNRPSFRDNAEKWEFQVMVYSDGTLKVSGYDCNIEDSGITLEAGRWGIYHAKNGCGNMLLQKWDNDLLK